MEALSLLERYTPEALCSHPIEQDRIELANKAADLLGYDRLQKKIKKFTGGASEELCKTLQLAGVLPFSDSSVAAYKRARQRELLALNVHNNLLNVLMWSGAAAAAMLFTAMAAGIAYIFVDWIALWAWLTPLIVAVVYLVALAVLFASTTTSTLLNRRVELCWWQTALTHYEKEIPDFVLQTAVRVCVAAGRLLEWYVEVPCPLDEGVYGTAQAGAFLVLYDNGKDYYMENFTAPCAATASLPVEPAVRQPRLVCIRDRD